MKKVKFTPGEGEFKGYVEIELPDRKTRLDFSKQKIDMFKDAKEGTSEILEIQFQYLEKIFNGCFVSIDLEHIETGHKICSKEDLDYFQEGQRLVNEIAGVCINGIEMGKILS